MDDLDLDQNDDTDVGDQPPEHSLAETVGAAVSMAQYLKAPDEVVGFLDSVSTDADLGAPGNEEAFAWMRENALGHLVDPLEARLADAASEADRVRQEREKTDRDAAKAALQKELDEREAEERRKAQEEKTRAELLAEIEAEKREAHPEATPEADQLVSVIQAGSQAAQAARRGEMTIEEAHKVTGPALEAAERLEQVEQGSGFKVDQDRLDKAAQQRLAKLREE